MSVIEDRARSIFLDALELVPHEWSAFLDQACGDDIELQARTNQLLQSHRELGTIHRGTGSPEVTSEHTLLHERPGALIGPYTLLEQIGEGGFGVVYLAEQERPVKRRVALKIIKPGMDTRQVIARFEAERQALALMDHPNIAKVLDAGTTETGRPYFVMELVQGVPITEYCDQCNLSTRERLELFVSVCQAVQHAHQKGVIHRDIKPTNVLVAIQDGRAAPKIIDFGVAKAINQRLTEHTLATGYAQIIGTPLYMSPEQAELSPLGADTRSDIYSLGVLLYELLAGATPFDKDRLHSVPYDELRRIIREEEPPRPSARLNSLATNTLPLVGRTGEGETAKKNTIDLATIAEHRRTDARRLQQTIRGELDWIVMKCLEKDRNRRYETANSLALDIERYLNDEPVQACPPSVAYRVSKFARRNKGILVAACFVAISLGLGLAVSIWQAAVARRAETLAEARLVRSQQVNQLMTDMLKGVAPGVALGRDTQLLREILDRTAKRLDRLQVQPEVEADLRAMLGNVYSDLGEPTSAAEMHKTALALRKLLHRDEHPDVQQSLNNLGQVNYWDARWSDAEMLHREAVELRRKLRNDPNKLAKAEALYREIQELDPQGATEHNVHLRLAEILLGKNPISHAQTQEARQLIQSAMNGYAEVAIQYPRDLDRRLGAAEGYVTVGKICHENRDFAAQVDEAHRRLIAELRDLLSAFPNSIQCQWQCAMIFRRWAFAVLTSIETTQLSQAEQAYRDAIELLKKKSLAAADPLRVAHYLASTHGYLGEVLVRLGRANEAEAAFRTAIELYDERPTAIEREPVEELEVSLDYIRFAYLLTTRQKQEAAVSLLDKAARSINHLGNTDFTAKHISCLAIMRLRMGDNAGYRAACVALEKAVEVSSESSTPIMLPWACGLGPDALEDLSGPLKQAESNVVRNPIQAPYFDQLVMGAILFRSGQYVRAAQHLEESVAQFPSDRPIGTGTVLFPQLLLAMTKWQLGQRDEARRMLAEIQPAIDRELKSPSSLWQRRAQLEVLRREAEDVIQPKEADDDVEDRGRVSAQRKP